MAKEKLGVGIVGLGNISDIHAQAIKHSEFGEIVAASSSSEEKLTKFKESYGGKGYTSYDDFLKDPDLDIVSICTPSGTHLDYGIKAANAGKHVVVEKPIEVTLERAGELIEACEKNNVRLSVIFQSRFTPDAIRMKEAIDNGELGDIFLVTANLKWYRGPDYFTSAPWRGTYKLDGGGAVINQSIHTIDLLQWFLGDVETITAFTGTLTHEGLEAEDNAVAALKFKSGALGNFTASTSSVPPQPRQIEVHGTKGTAILEDSNFRLVRSEEELNSDKLKEEAAGGADPLANLQYDAHRNQFNEIFKSILDGAENPIDGKEGVRALAFVRALYTSADTGKPVKLDELISQYITS